MELNYIIAESTVKPKEIEVGITTVYFRRNIKETQRTGEMGDGTPITMYVYEEAKLPKDQALRLFAETEAQNTANIDYMSMMTGVELPNED